MRTGTALGSIVLIGALAGCAGPVPAPTSTSSPGSTPTSTPSASTSATPTPEPEAGPPASFLLSGSDVVVLDAGGLEVETVPFSDAAGIVAAFTAVHGEPIVEAPGEYCDLSIAVWPSTDHELVVAYGVVDRTIIVVKGDGHAIQPSVGPAFGEAAATFTAALPAGHANELAYVYDYVGPAANGMPHGGIAFVDASGRVDSLVSPWVPQAGEFC